MTAAASLSHHEGWRAIAERPPRPQPELLTAAELGRLSEKSRGEYDTRRRHWHANILLKTPQVAAAHEQLWDIVDANLQDADLLRGSAAIDSPPALGKSTTVTAFGRDFHNQQIAEVGEYLDDNQDVRHLPVCRLTLTGGITTRGLHQQILRFYAHPSDAVTRGRGYLTAPAMAAAAADCVRRHRTRLMIIDDIHFLNLKSVEGRYVANQLKWIANEYDATFLFAGVGLRQRGLLSEGEKDEDLELAQTGRRWTLLQLAPFTLSTDAGAAAWRDTMLAIERKLVLAGIQPGMLADDLKEYLFIRSTGIVGSLMELVKRGAMRAIRTGREYIDQELLDQIRIDEAAESRRAATAGEFATCREARRRARASARQAGEASTAA